MPNPIATLALEHQAGLTALARRLSNNTCDADDLLQDAWVNHLSRAVPALPVESFSAWMGQVLRRAAVDRFRSASRRESREALVGGSLVGGAVLPDEALAHRTLGVAIATALATLPVAQQRAVWLVDAEGLSFAQAARVLDLRPGTVASRVARGRSALRTSLCKEAAEFGVVP